MPQNIKKPLPKYPKRIAIITSSAGAAVHDMLRILNARWPMSEVVLLPVRVQGAEAPPEIAGALRYANKWQVADLIITGRGGGSIEDLWAFNDERVARAIYASDIPVISAVGHEPDVTIADFVADARASTPSNAAEIAVPDQREIYRRLDALQTRMVQSEQKRVKALREQFEKDVPQPCAARPHGIYRRQADAARLHAEKTLSHSRSIRWRSAHSSLQRLRLSSTR